MHVGLDTMVQRLVQTTVYEIDSNTSKLCAGSGQAG
jgi:hypothetical protein